LGILLQIGKLIAVCILAILLSLSSVLIERIGPEVVQYENMCGVSGSEPCTRLQLKGGYPAAYLFDSGGVSVANKLGLEDEVVVSAFLLNCALYAAAVLLTLRIVSRATAIWRRSKPSGVPGDA
jgi:hypothetical protein